MEIISKCAMAAVFGSLVCLLIKKHNPELSVAVSLVFSTLVLIAAVPLLDAVKELMTCAVDMLGTSSTMMRPMIKCMCISFISKFAADTCRDASQAAAASALELTGTLCSASVAMPVIISMLKMIGTLV